VRLFLQARSSLEVTIILIRKGLSSSIGKLLLVLGHELGVDLDLWRCERGCRDEFEVVVADELAGEPEERLLKVVVGLGADLKVLKVLLAVECHGASLDFSLLEREKGGTV
jgi:hypothetical protein